MLTPNSKKRDHGGMGDKVGNLILVYRERLCLHFKTVYYSKPPDLCVLNFVNNRPQTLMNNPVPTMLASLTYDDYCQIPDDGNRYEVIEGVLYMSPSPIFRHQKILRKLSMFLSNWVEQTKNGELLFAPMDVVLSDQDVVQPDILFISTNRLSIIEEKNIQGAPDLLIEILSEGNRRHDEIVKRDLYETHGVQEYWIVDPVLETIKVYRLEEARFIKAAEWSLEASDAISSPLLPGFECRLVEVFGE